MAIEVNIYRYSVPIFAKSFAKLVEMLYAKKLLILILCDSDDSLKECDNLLWTYSQLSFLPHGTMHDPYNKEQDIYITDNIMDNPKNAKVVIIYRGERFMDEIFLLHFDATEYKCVVFIDNKNEEAMLHFIAKLKANSVAHKVFTQKEDGSWRFD